LTTSTTQATPAPPDIVALQRRTLRVLFGVQVLGGIAVGIGIAVGALLIEDLTGSSTYAGFAQSIFVGGSALLVIPVVRITNRLGRRAGLVFSYACAVLGALVVLGAIAIANPLLAVAGYFLLGGGSITIIQSRNAPCLRRWTVAARGVPITPRHRACQPGKAPAFGGDRAGNGELDLAHEATIALGEAVANLVAGADHCVGVRAASGEAVGSSPVTAPSRCRVCTLSGVS
jgi:hypothetical protein